MATVNPSVSAAPGAPVAVAIAESEAPGISTVTVSAHDRVVAEWRVHTALVTPLYREAVAIVAAAMVPADASRPMLRLVDG